MNNVVLAGKLTKDPEGKDVGDARVVRFGLAVRRRFKGKDGVDVDFFDCEVWRKPAEIVERFLKKGSYIVVSGDLRNDSWEDKNGGGKRTKTMVNVENVSLGPNPNAASSQENQAGPSTGKADEDIPF